MTKYKKLSAEFFTRNRANFMKEMTPGSLAVFFSNDMMPRSADAFYNFRQNPDLYYLTGIDQEDCMLILFPDSSINAYKEILFLKETNEHIAVWEGAKVDKEQGKEFSGIQTVVWNDQFEKILNMLMYQAASVYINLNENDRSGSEVAYKDLRFANELKLKFPLHKYERSGPIMSGLRSIKSQDEIDAMQHACNITEKAFRRVLETLKPGMLEYEVEAEIIYEFIKNGASGHAYQPIIATGKNACVLHYTNNNAVCKDGDLLLMDFGSEYAMYTSDLTRTIPVNGKFSARQKEVYNACLRIHNETKAALRTGVTLNELNIEAKKMMTSALIDIKLIDKTADEKTQTQLTQKYFPHGNSHFLGLDVHDIGNRYAKVENNMCFTVEPGIYIPDENIGIRIENDVIVHDKGNIDLMKNIPITVEEIEDLMAK